MAKVDSEQRIQRNLKPLPQRSWSLREAKTRFEALVQLAITQGPQRVTNGRHEAVVLVSAKDYERIRRRSRQSQTLVDFFADSPFAKLGIILGQAPEATRRARPSLE